MSYASVVLSDSPVIYWRLDEASGNFADSSGNGWTATKTGSATVTYSVTPFGVIGGSAISLPYNGGVGACGQTADGSFQFANADSFTLEAWVNTPHSYGGGNSRSIFSSGDSGIAFYVLNAGELHLDWAGTASIGSSTATVDDAQWHHIVVTKNGSTVHFYVDGVEGTGTITNSTIANTALKKCFGGSLGSDNTPIDQRWFVGSIDEVAVYDGALSAARVLAHYEAGAGISGAAASLEVLFARHALGAGRW